MTIKLIKAIEKKQLINRITSGKFTNCRNPIAIRSTLENYQFIRKNCNGCYADSKMGCKIYQLDIPISFIGESNQFHYDPNLRVRQN